MANFIKAEKKLKIVIHEGNPQMKTFTLKDEDHTFGNMLTYMLDKFPETEFCAYTIGHPQDNAIHVQLKVKPGYSVDKTFEKGLVEIKAALSILKVKFVDEMTIYLQNEEACQ